MKSYRIEILERDDGTFSFSLEGAKDIPYDPENIADLLVEVAHVLYEEECARHGATIH